MSGTTHEHTKTEVVEEATCTEDGVKTYKCSHCNKTRTEDSTAHHTFIAGGCDKQNCPLRYQYADEDDYQIMAYVYSSVEDVKSDNKEVLYFSFPNDTTDIPQIAISNLLRMKNKTVKYICFYLNNLSQSIAYIDENPEYLETPYPLTDFVNNGSPIYIVVE